jgi:hypothetical protein
MQERRRHVRAKPLPELPARVLRMVSAPITETLDVVDISVSGLAILQGMKPESVGSTIGMKLVLPDATYETKGAIRWVARGMYGIELVEPTEEVSTAIRRYVGELLERGSRA